VDPGELAAVIALVVEGFENADTLLELLWQRKSRQIAVGDWPGAGLKDQDRKVNA